VVRWNVGRTRACVSEGVDNVLLIGRTMGITCTCNVIELRVIIIFGVHSSFPA